MYVMFGKIMTFSAVHSHSIEDSFQFVTGEFGNCSQPCDGGVRNRNVSCVLFNEGMQSNQTVEEARCTMPKPSTFEACNEIPCPIYSVTGNFGEVSRTIILGE